MPRGMHRVRYDHLFLHGLRIAACAGVLAAHVPIWTAVPVSVALFFAAFSLAHDATHGALGLPKRANAIVLSLSALFMLISGHAMRRMHLLHHARPLSEKDIEGRGANLSAVHALLAGPSNALALRLAAFRGARRDERIVQVVETLAAAALLGIATRSAPLALYVAIAIVMQLSMSLWASHIPHNAPAFAVAICKRLAILRSPVLLSLAYHDLHHRRPGVPCQELGRTSFQVPRRRARTTPAAASS